MYIAHICAEALATSLPPDARARHLSPLAGRSKFVRSSRKFRVRGRLHESEPVERPPHPDPLHSPSQTGVNALMASGEREQRRRCAKCDYPASRVSDCKAEPVPALDLARGQLFLFFLEKFVLGHFPFDHIGELNDEVHHLFLKNRRPHARELIVTFLVVLPHCPLAHVIWPRPLKPGPAYS